MHVVLRVCYQTDPAISRLPLLVTLVIGGLPMLYDLLQKLLKRKFGSDESCGEPRRFPVRLQTSRKTMRVFLNHVFHRAFIIEREMSRFYQFKRDLFT